MERNEEANCELLFTAATKGDWDFVKQFLGCHPEALMATMGTTQKTALHFAISFRDLAVVKELLDMTAPEQLEMADGYTALAHSVMLGELQMAKLLVEKNVNLTRIICEGLIPLTRALGFGRTEMAYYLYSVTPLDALTSGNGVRGAYVVRQFLDYQEFDIVLDLLQKCPRLAFTRDYTDIIPIFALNFWPSAFRSGRRLTFWQRFIYRCVHVHLPPCFRDNLQLEVKESNPEQRVTKKGSDRFSGLFQKLASFFLELLGIKQTYELKLMHKKTERLLQIICTEARTANDLPSKNWDMLVVVQKAVESGVVELAIEMIKANPEVLQCSTTDIQRTLCMAAVQFRQEKILNFIISSCAEKNMVEKEDTMKNNLLHYAGLYPPLSELDRIAGSALQMQREIQWFKEIESILPPKYKDKQNSLQLVTARQLFTVNHKDLVKEGETWMKDTATSCTVVAALIVTIVFAAAFTVPGGNDSDGYPLFLHKKLFMVFIISDAISLFSSSTSVLMFLGILTSRFGEEDFLLSLPRKLMIGLFTLFLSIASMMIAFSAALLLMLRGQLWISIPTIAIATFPVTLFLWLQLQLLIDIFNAIYRSKIIEADVKRYSW